VYRFVLAPRWLAFHVFVAVVVFACVQLGSWQLDRWHERRDVNAAVEDRSTRPPAPVSELVATTAEGVEIDPTDQWRAVSATGRYDAERGVLLRNRTYDGVKGFEVIVPLVTGDGTALLVNRGWVRAGRTATESIDVPAPPAGEVTVTGRLRPSQHASPEQRGQADDGAQRSVVRLDVPWLGERLPYPVYAGYAELTEESPAPSEAPELLPAPDLGTGPHLAYAMQWWVFAVIGVVGWVLLMRREARDGQAAEAPAVREAEPARSAR
jgi:cytochrome oxidase assembly protein ShyY1